MFYEMRGKVISYLNSVSHMALAFLQQICICSNVTWRTVEYKKLQKRNFENIIVYFSTLVLRNNRDSSVGIATRLRAGQYGF
jgi:hypothetical protein